MIQYECLEHGILNENTSWINHHGRVICGKCGKPALCESVIDDWVEE